MFLRSTPPRRADLASFLLPAGARSLRGALRQLRQLDVTHRNLPRQRTHPGFNRLYLSVGEVNSTLVNRHVTDRLLQSRDRAVMKVWSRLIDVPQRGDLEHHFVELLLGHLVTSLIGLSGPRFHNAELLVCRPPDIRTVVVQFQPFWRSRLSELGPALLNATCDRLAKLMVGALFVGPKCGVKSPC